MRGPRHCAFLRHASRSNIFRGILSNSTIRHLQGSDQFGEEEFRPATEVFSQGAPGDFDLDFLQQHGTQSSSVSHLAR